MTHRFFIEEDVRDDVALRGDQARQIASVLRLVPGDQISVVRDGVESAIVLESVTSEEVRGRCISKRTVDEEPRFRMTLALPILRGDRSEEVIEAVTQLGVSRFVPFVSARSVVRELPRAKRERWVRIAQESAETARRGRIPAVDEVAQWDRLFGVLDPPALVAWEGEALVHVSEVAAGPRLSLVIGPEGGLAIDEIAYAREQGAVTVTLGPRNLRSETAAIAAVTQVMAILER